MPTSTGDKAPQKISLNDAVIAYRHTKAELFSEKFIPSRLDLLKYEDNLIENLEDILSNINRSERTLKAKGWIDTHQFLGQIFRQPKAVEPTDKKTDRPINSPHLYVTDAKARWEDFKNERKPSTSFRTMAVPSINFQILGMLWIMKVGHLLDQRLLKSCRGNRLKRLSDFGEREIDKTPSIKDATPHIFHPYYFAYQNWRGDGLKAIEAEVQQDNRVIAITMDLKQYYHKIDPAVIGDDRFWKENFDIDLNSEQKHLNNLLTTALKAWAERSPEKMGIPVGLLASKIISNALLHSFDKAISDKLNPVFYARYVDDILLVIRPTPKLRTAPEIMEHVKTQLGEIVDLGEGDTTLTLRLPNVGTSVLEFGASKQRIFDFQGSSGQDLLDTVNREIDELSSEFRLMPDVSEEEGSVLKKALVADHDLELGADSLRKADSLTIRRLGLAILLRNHEMLERCMADPKEWESIRTPFYKLVEEHVLTPERYGTYFQYLPRIFGLIAANSDWDVGDRLLKRLEWAQSEFEMLKTK